MRRGITIIEVLVVIAIGIVLLGGAVMFLARHRDNALRAHCHKNIGDISLAVQAYYANSSANEKHRTLPPARIAEGHATWLVLLAPMLMEGKEKGHVSPAFKEHPLLRWDQQQTYFAQAEDVRQAAFAKFFCPARHRADARSQAGDLDATGTHFPGILGDYGAVAGDGAAPWNGALVPAEVSERKDQQILAWKSRTSLASLPRGEAHTMIVGEKHVAPDDVGDAKLGDGALFNGANSASFSRHAGPGFPLARAWDESFNQQFGSWHRNICHFAFADGSARAMSNQTMAEILGKLSRREH